LSYWLPHDGTYYVEVRDYSHPYEGGSDYAYDIQIITDSKSPAAVEITSPTNNAWMQAGARVGVAATDNESGVQRVEFLWHDADWNDPDWVWLGADTDGRDGWTWDFDATQEVEQRGGAFYVWAFDWIGNWTGAASWNLGIDRTPPGVPGIYTGAQYGDAPFRDFRVWWGASDNLSGLGGYEVQYQTNTADTWSTLALDTTETYTRFVGMADHTYSFRARARDVAGNVSNFSDGSTSYTVNICDVAPDVHEGDDSGTQATSITPDGYTQIHNIHHEEDVDWVKFSAQAGVTYELLTGNSGGHADTVLELYDSDGNTLLDENDDCPNRWPASCLTWHAPRSDTYYVKLYHWDPWAYGCTTEYGVAITSDRATSDFKLGSPGTAFRYADTLGTTGRPYLSDEEHINWPRGVAVDRDGNIYVAELMGHRLLKFSPDGSLLWSYGEAGVTLWEEGYLNYPNSVALDESRNRVYVAVNDTHAIRVLDMGGNYVDSIGVLGESGSDNAHFNSPRGVAVAEDGTLYVADAYNHRVQIFDSTGNYQATLGSGYGTGNDQFRRPEGVALDDGNGRIYVADYDNHRVQVFSAAHTHVTTLGVTGESGADNAHFNNPNNLIVDTAGNIYVADTHNHRVQKFDDSFNHVTTLGVSGVLGADNAHFHSPSALAIGPDGALYVADGNNHRVQKFDAALDYQNTLGISGIPYLTDAEHLNHPGDVDVDEQGNLFIVERSGHRLLKMRPDGSLLATVGTPGVVGDDNVHFDWPQGVAVAPNGTVYVVETYNNRVQVYDHDLNYQTTLGTGFCGSESDEFCGPHKVDVDADGFVYVADTYNHRIQVFNSSHILVATLGLTGESGQDNLHFSNPRGVAVDDEGYVYVADEANQRVQICTVAGGSGTCTTFVGESGVVSDDFAHLRAPLDVAVDANGRVYVVDSWWNQRVQIFDDQGAYLNTLGGEWGSEPGRFRNPNGIAFAPDGSLYVADLDNMRLQHYTPGVPKWTRMNINGFGDPATTGVTALVEFGDVLYVGASNWNSSQAQLWRMSQNATWINVTPSDLTSKAFIELVVYDDQLYAGTGWGGSRGQIWRSDDGNSWSAVVSDGFGDSNNGAVSQLTEFNGHLYATAQNNYEGFSIWRSATGDAGTWASVLAHGNGNAYLVTGMQVFKGQLYVASENRNQGLEIWRSPDGESWEQIVSGGFNDSRNSETGALGVFDGYLYVGTRNNTTGGQLWRSADGSIWQAVMTNGFGDADNEKLETFYVAYDALYTTTNNGAKGAQIYRSVDGTNWEAVIRNGWGDSNNTSVLWNNAAIVYDDHLMLGTWNNAHGGELWRYALQEVRADFVANPLSDDTPPATVDFTNRSTGDYTSSQWNFGDGVTSTIADPTHTYQNSGSYTVTLTISGLGGEDTMRKQNYIFIVESYKIFLPAVLR
jgi:PKD repeat protein/uncharacterized protein YjiK